MNLKGRTFEEIYIIGCNGERNRITSFSPAKIVFQGNEALPVSTKYEKNWAVLRDARAGFRLR